MSLVPISFSLTTHLIENGVRHEMIGLLPPEILSYLEPDDLDRCCQVNREWNVLAKDDALWKAMFSAVVFGGDQWQKHFGEVGVVPSLSPNIYEILQNPCLFWPSKRVAETHFLVLIPQTVNGKPLTLNTLEQLIRNPQGGGRATNYHYYSKRVREQLGDQSISASYWALMTKDVIPNSRDKTYADQQALLKEPYVIPRILEITTGILMYYTRTGERLYDRSWAYTRCQETIRKNWRAVVGAFDSCGLRLLGSNDFWSSGCVGGVRNF